MSDTLHKNRGFTLVELIIVMLIFVVVIGLIGAAFNQIVSKSLFLTKTAESNIAGIVGLELMRVDVDSSGYGVPWAFSRPINYTEAGQEPGLALNDNGRAYASDPTQDNVPRAVMSTNNIASVNPAVVFNGSDVLTVRSQSVATSTAAKRWSYVESAVMPNTNPAPQRYVWSSDNLQNTNTVIMIQPIAALKPTKQLVVNPSGTWSATYANYSAIGKPPVYNDAEKKSDTYIIYGVDDAAALVRPFNRADYYVRRPAAGDPNLFRQPQRCNAATGVLVKGLVAHNNAGTYNELPLLECVLDLQVVYELRTSASAMLTDSSDISALTPKEVREQVKAIKVYILTHDGGRDRNYTYPNATIGVGPGDGIISGTGRTYDFAANGVPDWQNYRWRVYQLVARPSNLTGSIAQ